VKLLSATHKSNEVVQSDYNDEPVP
jgi:hypothetical protein